MGLFDTLAVTVPDCRVLRSPESPVIGDNFILCSTGSLTCPSNNAHVVTIRYDVTALSIRSGGDKCPTVIAGEDARGRVAPVRY